MMIAKKLRHVMGRFLAPSPVRELRQRRRRTLMILESLEERLVLTTNQGFVTQAYIDLLGRQPDPQGLANAVGALNGGMSRTALASIFEASQEYRQDDVNRLYEFYLHRQADPAALVNAVNGLASGLTDQSLGAEMIGSAEFYQDAGGTSAGFGTALYEDAFGRDIDPAAQANLSSQLANGTSRTDLANYLLASPEFREDFAQLDYQKFLRRSADPGGLANAAALLTSGGDEAVIADLVGSDEYFNRIPAAPSVPTLASTSEGSSGSAVVSTTPTPTLQGNAEPFSTVTLYDGNIPVGTSTSGVAGNWSIASSSLTNGPHSITARATNALGHTGPASASFSLTVSTQGTRLVLAGQPTTATAGAAIAPLTVEVEDPFGNLITSGTPTITVALASGGGTLMGTTTATAVNGIAVFSNLSIQMAGSSHSLAFSGGGLAGLTSSSFAVTPASASKLAFAGQPTTTTAGQTISPAVVVDVEDAYGNLITSSSAAVTMAITGSPGALTGTLTVNAVNGVATFANLSTTTAGTYTLTATGGALNSAVSSPFLVNPGVASTLAVLNSPLDTVAGSTIAPVLVAVEDAYGNVVTTAQDVVSAASTGVGSLLGTVTAPVVNGIATFNNLMLQKAGSQGLSFASGALADAATSAFNILPAAATQLMMVTQPSSTLLGDLIDPVVVDVTDAYGNVVTTANNTVTTGLNSGTGVLLGPASVMAVNGVATFNGLEISLLGINDILGFNSGSLTGTLSDPFSIV